jgi:zinc protease
VTPAPRGSASCPRPGAPIAPVLPQPVETRLANGVRVVTVERHDLPLVTASLVALGGAATDPTGRGEQPVRRADDQGHDDPLRHADRAVESVGGSIASSATDDGATIDDRPLGADRHRDDDPGRCRHPPGLCRRRDRARADSVDRRAERGDEEPGATVRDGRRPVVYGSRAYGQPLSARPPRSRR